MDRFTKETTLSKAYKVSENVGSFNSNQLLWAMDRFWDDRADVDECSQEQRGDATQVIARELDRRGVAVRDPNNPALVLFPGAFPGNVA